MALVSRLGRFLLRNARSSLTRASVRHYDPETGGEEIKSTSVSILSKEDDDYLYVEAYSQIGFRLSNGFRIIGPCVLFPRSVLHWGVAGIHELNEESLALFPLLEPKLDILVLGIGDHGQKYDKNIIKYLRSSRINVEILPTDQACSTFNFLNAERRVVAAGLIPPTYMHLDNDEDLEIRAQLAKGGGKLFELKHGFTEDPSAATPGEFAPALEDLRERMGIKQKDGGESGEKRSEDRDSESAPDKKER
ncbi:NADH dehydrogenase [ubiquinone] 1 alpha subcomplex assembly factor 3-like [Babylonia areolata]|uniref:NADH dehydrogenase [ubiquinone] 1 alpha subcomplex assembly factor 3-like n=1 Tax=Babylonia areolata TaxID=304850 RepID=UPI003FCEF9DA